MQIFRAEKTTPTEIFRQLSELDKQCVGADGWSAESFISEAARESGIVLYAAENSRIAGLICGCFGADQADITSVAVAPECRRQGIADNLICEFISLLPCITESIFLEVRESNSAAIALYKKNGFEQISIRKRFYSSPVENAIIMKKDLNKEG
ncbi:MAG: ribosomal protein S18-alanine N-acetyltransferase [Ruminococcus sp.]|nr:ribosomal protein S18-alanine N-acetyltransferase [Ruminococcus sp.]